MTSTIVYQGHLERQQHIQSKHVIIMYLENIFGLQCSNTILVCMHVIENQAASRRYGDHNCAYQRSGLQSCYLHKSTHMAKGDVTYQENVEIKGWLCSCLQIVSYQSTTTPTLLDLS